ncbi:hypothetical protein K8I85_15680 [bacterium]|nr:hypothetical protein [bacterium]
MESIERLGQMWQAPPSLQRGQSWLHEQRGLARRNDANVVLMESPASLDRVSNDEYRGRIRPISPLVGEQPVQLPRDGLGKAPPEFNLDQLRPQEMRIDHEQVRNTTKWLPKRKPMVLVGPEAEKRPEDVLHADTPDPIAASAEEVSYCGLRHFSLCRAPELE